MKIPSIARLMRILKIQGIISISNNKKKTPDTSEKTRNCIDNHNTETKKLFHCGINKFKCKQCQFEYEQSAVRINHANDEHEIEWKYCGLLFRNQGISCK